MAPVRKRIPTNSITTQPASGKRSKSRQRGYYSHKFTQLETSDLETILSSGLDDEIAMLRVMTRRLFDMADSKQTLDIMISLNSALGLAASRLAGMLKSQKLLAGGAGDDLARHLSNALSKAIEDMKVVRR